MRQDTLQLKASKTFKWVYCLTLIGYIFPLGLFASSGWVGLTMGGGLFSYGRMVPVVVLVLFGIRIIYIIRKPQALDIYATSLLVKLGRSFGALLMYVGLAGVVGIFFIKPLTLVVFSSVGVYVVGVLLVLVASVGLPGLLVFEVSRLLGGRRVLTQQSE